MPYGRLPRPEWHGLRVRWISDAGSPGWRRVGVTSGSVITGAVDLRGERALSADYLSITGRPPYARRASRTPAQAPTVGTETNWTNGRSPRLPPAEMNIVSDLEITLRVALCGNLQRLHEGQYFALSWSALSLFEYIGGWCG